MKKNRLAVFLLLACFSCFAASFTTSNKVMAGNEPATAGTTDILLLTCMDYRLVQDIHHYMSDQGLTKKYDHIVLAGASLGASTSKFPAWGKTFWEHLKVAIDLHHIHKVMIMDHKDCGAYRVILGEGAVGTPELEMKAHRTQLRNLARQIKAQYPKLEVELLLMSLDGSVEPIAETKAAKM